VWRNGYKGGTGRVERKWDGSDEKVDGIRRKREGDESGKRE
jgi:hypothetical protein